MYSHCISFMTVNGSSPNSNSFCAEINIHTSLKEQHSSYWTTPFSVKPKVIVQTEMPNFLISEIKRESLTLNIPERSRPSKDAVSLPPRITLIFLLNIHDTFCHFFVQAASHPRLENEVGAQLQTEFRLLSLSPAKLLIHCAASCSHASVYNQQQDQAQFM